MSAAVENFVESVEHFCQWVEGESRDVLEARQLLLSLMVSIPHLSEYRTPDGGVADGERRGRDAWDRDHRRFANLPFQYYRSVFDPHDLDAADEPEVGDLHDDLADIYSDLWSGLQAHRAGDPEGALAIWVDYYFCHWGQHASSALHAIDTHYRQGEANAPSVVPCWDLERFGRFLEIVRTRADRLPPREWAHRTNPTPTEILVDREFTLTYLRYLNY